MKKKIVLPADELPHQNQAIEWWYFNGFLKGKNNYAFMTCLFKASSRKLNMRIVKLPREHIYFSHTVLFNLDKKKVEKEVLPIVIISGDSFRRKELFANYFFPFRKEYFDYEISRNGGKLRVKTKFFDINLKQNKKPMLEGGTGFIDLGEKTTYYYSYTNLDAEGYVGEDYVKGKAWHDRQWSSKGYMKDSWLWFSFQMPDNTEIACFDYKGKKMATISYPDNRQETTSVVFTPVGRKWKSKKTGVGYNLEWEIKIGKFLIRTKPVIKNCEVNFGNVNYWEGPLNATANGKNILGFMELVAEQKSGRIRYFIKKEEKKLLSKFY